MTETPDLHPFKWEPSARHRELHALAMSKWYGSHEYWHAIYLCREQEAQELSEVIRRANRRHSDLVFQAQQARDLLSTLQSWDAVKVNANHLRPRVAAALSALDVALRSDT